MEVPGDEVHFLNFCETFTNQRNCLLGKLRAINPTIQNLNKIDQVKIMLCPTTPTASKLVNKFILIMLKARTNIDNGDHVSNLTFPPHVFPEFSLDDSQVSNSSSSSNYDSDSSFDFE